MSGFPQWLDNLLVIFWVPLGRPKITKNRHFPKKAVPGSAFSSIFAANVVFLDFSIDSQLILDEKSFPGTAFLGECRFLLIFGIPGGTQKLLKIYESFPVKGSWEPSGSHFGRFNAFFWFWLHFWCILAPPGPFFDEFASFFDHVFDVIFSSLLPFFWVFLGICGGSGGLVLLVILVLLVGGWVEWWWAQYSSPLLYPYPP